jgi:hypothetical protein
MTDNTTDSDRAARTAAAARYALLRRLAPAIRHTGGGFATISMVAVLLEKRLQSGCRHGRDH